MANYNPLAWETNFPPVYGHTSVSFLTRCPGFRDAKLGDMRAASKVVNKCINSKTIDEIKKKYPDATLLPVITKNKLPESLAMTIGMRTHMEVHQLETLSRKSLSAMERLLHKPIFDGRIIRDKRYIIVDDIITQGGTVSALRKHIISIGGTVSAIVTLSYSPGSNILVPNHDEIFCLINRFSFHSIINILRHYNIANDLQELTRAQIRYMLLFKELDRFVNKIEKSQETINVYRNKFLMSFPF